ncbi:reverse transcriptase [Senna tora]|uniref:Reverse transcriptase n=1 Tax=Senna tora TaxID=362788 RepID=A0A834W7F9_9FABA|nr:reverse transcriptase [Senna tora]
MFNFPDHFTKLIMSCLQNVSYSTQINGKITNTFSPQRGIRQGDPISPYLFILAIEYLNLLPNWPPTDSLALPNNINNEITSTFVHLSNNTPDLLAWKYSKDGVFSIKTAYNLIFNHDTETTNLKWLWKAPAHPRELFFLWQIFQNALPTAKKLHNINCLQSPLCPLCLTEEETPIHILRDCQFSRSVWLFFKVPPSFFHNTIQAWVKSNIKDTSSNIHNVPWNTLFSYILRGIWLARNNKIFQGKTVIPPALAQQILQKASEYTFLNSNHPPISPKQTIQISWLKPKPNFYKLNVGGSCAENQLGSGGIIRDDKGNHIISFSHYHGTGNVIIAELWALQLGIKLGVNLGLQKLEIESDSNAVIHLMENQNLPNTSAFFPVINNCRFLLQSLPEWEIRHCYREANKCADALANHGRISKLQNSVKNDPPALILDHLHFDQKSCHIPRSVPNSRPTTNVFALENS